MPACNSFDLQAPSAYHEDALSLPQHEECLALVEITPPIYLEPVHKHHRRANEKAAQV